MHLRICNLSQDLYGFLRLQKLLTIALGKKNNKEIKK